MNKIVYFHRNIQAGYSINKVTQTYVSFIPSKEEFYVPSNRATPLAVLRNLLFVFFNRNRKCVNHITGDIHYCILALWGCKSVLTIHDTFPIHYSNDSGLKRFYNKLLWFTIPIKLATKVVCISEETRRKVVEISGRKDVEVIMDPLSSSFHFESKSEMDSPPKVLIIGTAPNKNLKRTIQALNGIECQVTIIGRLTDEIHRELMNNNIAFDNKINLSDDEIYQEYVKCDIVSFVSLFEGFGMPIIEAQAVGRVVITSNLPPMNEIANDSNSILVDPYSVESIRQGFIRAIEQSDLRNQLISQGIINIQRFDPKVIADQYLRLYETI